MEVRPIEFTVRAHFYGKKKVDNDRSNYWLIKMLSSLHNTLLWIYNIVRDL